jgi:hypothetical protein
MLRAILGEALELVIGASTYPRGASAAVCTQSGLARVPACRRPLLDKRNRSGSASGLAR